MTQSTQWPDTVSELFDWEWYGTFGEYLWTNLGEGSNEYRLFRFRELTWGMTTENFVHNFVDESEPGEDLDDQDRQTVGEIDWAGADLKPGASGEEIFAAMVDAADELLTPSYYDFVEQWYRESGDGSGDDLPSKVKVRAAFGGSIHNVQNQDLDTFLADLGSFGGAIGMDQVQAARELVPFDASKGDLVVTDGSGQLDLYAGGQVAMTYQLIRQGGDYDGHYYTVAIQVSDGQLRDRNDQVLHSLQKNGQECYYAQFDKDIILDVSGLDMLFVMARYLGWAKTGADVLGVIRRENHRLGPPTLRVTPFGGQNRDAFKAKIREISDKKVHWTDD